MAYLDLSARYALDIGLHVIVEGILFTPASTARCSPTFLAEHRGVTHCYPATS